MITIFGAVKTLNFYDRLKNVYNFGVHKLAVAERPTIISESKLPMRESLLFNPEDLADLFNQF